MIEGFCVPCRADVPSTLARNCAECGHILIPPTWSNRLAVYPWPARPAGWSPPKEPEPKGRNANKAPIAAMCGYCFAPFTYVPKGGSAQTYCPGTPCKSRAQNARRFPQRVKVAS